jgi:hypothetical protein
VYGKVITFVDLEMVIVDVVATLVVEITVTLAIVGNKQITKTSHSLVIRSTKDHLQWFLVL